MRNKGVLSFAAVFKVRWRSAGVHREPAPLFGTRRSTSCGDCGLDEMKTPISSIVGIFCTTCGKKMGD